MKDASELTTVESPAFGTQLIPSIVTQYADEAIALYGIRASLLDRPQVKLRHLGRLDDRLEAHLDGLSLVGEYAWRAVWSELENPSSGAAFVTTFGAIEEGKLERLGKLLRLVEALDLARPGTLSAFGYVAPNRLRNLVIELLVSARPFERLVGLTACSMHRVDPGLKSGRRLEDPDPAVRARAWRAMGELGMHDLRPIAAAALSHEQDTVCRFWGAWSAALLGAKSRAIDLLRQVSAEPGPLRSRAFHLAIQTMSIAESHAFLQPLAQDPVQIRRLVHGAGLAGDPRYVPWLVEFMTNEPLARLAGESLALITGLDLARQDCQRNRPEDFESGPNDDPNDPNVEMDEDDGLPWPDQAKIQAWWNANSHRFQPGVRYFMGEPLNRENCLRVLKDGFQRQRILAAHYLCLLNPGTVLFNTSAPAWRQQRLLAQMT